MCSCALLLTLDNTRPSSLRLSLQEKQKELEKTVSPLMTKLYAGGGAPGGMPGGDEDMPDAGSAPGPKIEEVD